MIDRAESTYARAPARARPEPRRRPDRPRVAPAPQPLAERRAAPGVKPSDTVWPGAGHPHGAQGQAAGRHCNGQPRQFRERNGPTSSRDRAHAHERDRTARRSETSRTPRHSERSAPMHALIVHCHPEPVSFNAALTEVTGTTLRLQGYSVEISDLYREDFDPCERSAHYRNRENRSVFSPLGEQRHAFRTDTLPDVGGCENARLFRLANSPRELTVPVEA